MITIIKRELLDNLKSTQFIVLFIVSLVLFAASSVLSVGAQEAQMKSYAEKTIEAAQHPSTQSVTLLPRPETLLFLSHGGARNLPAEYTLLPGGYRVERGATEANYKLPDVPELDWLFVIKLVFSLLVILTGYDTIAGERQQGTLRLLLSAPTGRARLLAAKYVAILTTVAVALFCGMLLGLIVAILWLPGLLTMSTLLTVFMTFLLALFYLSVFALLSLAVSSAVHQSSLALLLLLAVWVLFTIIVPETSGVLAEKSAQVPSEFQLAKEVGPTIQKEIWKRIGALQDRISAGELRTEEEVRREADRAFSDGQAAFKKYLEQYAIAIRARAATARSYSRFSPTALFQYAGEGLAGTGVDKEAKFLRDLIEYSTTYDHYVEHKVGKVVTGTFWAFGVTVELNGKTIFLRSPHPEEYQGDKSDFPAFTETAWSSTDRINNALGDAAGLVLWNLLLAGLSFIAILRSDVR
ncbi:hypothetical protein EHM92_05475 [bacterium]|nr:MAG: hypothetical protein EHM92_05475 [bacterium]